MPSPYCERAISDALTFGKALVKVISPNDTGRTGGHQYGYYLPKKVWQIFTPNPPIKGTNSESLPRIIWQDGRVTESRVVWYGKGTRSEYRLTRFGPDFPHLSYDSVGDLLVLVIESHDKFRGFVLFDEDDIEELLSALGIQFEETWGAYDANVFEPPIDEEKCIGHLFSEFTAKQVDFPSTTEFSNYTWFALRSCVSEFSNTAADKRLRKLIEEEFNLFKLVERFLCNSEVTRLFKDIDDFLKVAATIMNRRKSRAGRSFENHVELLLNDYKVPHEMRPYEIDGKPDIIIPSKAKYFDPTWPDELLFSVGLKTTCKDRWRQVLNEAKRVRVKHLITLQPSISSKQLAEMKESGVVLIVPKHLHKSYPKDSGMELLTVEKFIESVSSRLGEYNGRANA